MTVVDDRAWMTAANCRGVDPNLFHPEQGQPIRDAVAVCRGCTVRAECLEYAMADRELRGVWGGVSEVERKRMRPRWRRARMGVAL